MGAVLCTHCLSTCLLNVFACVSALNEVEQLYNVSDSWLQFFTTPTCRCCWPRTPDWYTPWRRLYRSTTTTVDGDRRCGGWPTAAVGTAAPTTISPWFADPLLDWLFNCVLDKWISDICKVCGLYCCSTFLMTHTATDCCRMIICTWYQLNVR